jgi:diguanylate cyclase (GGDEF)-like protein
MFSVILIDIDNFKEANDLLGHNTGDYILVEFAETLENSLRSTDFLFRWGGEEFLVLLSHCDSKTAYQVAEKLRHTISKHAFRLKSDISITASFGVASYSENSNIEQLINHADSALYQSKERGKNRTTLFSKNL